VSVLTGDLRSPVPRDLIKGHEALINCAGHVADGDPFVGLIDGLVTSADSLPLGEQPVCWLLAGAALLDLDPSARRGVELPRVNLHLLAPSGQLRAADPLASGLAIALPRTDGRRGRDRTGPAAHLGRHNAGSRSGIRSRFAGPALPAGLRIPDSADDRALRDAAALMLANVDPGHAWSRRRIGLALPVGMRGRKSERSAKTNPGSAITR
jgi:hypothetical protein